ncbi:conserved hypothetical protein [Trichinella spiralis]|uniref:hypothetical protein n=1 Tax=Trichinella spiralis TaxID=6334 RepID=UPI0001EFE0CE|nr:conserved hypothetical protein [Trichinella spiralis]
MVLVSASAELPADASLKSTLDHRSSGPILPPRVETRPRPWPPTSPRAFATSFRMKDMPAPVSKMQSDFGLSPRKRSGRQSNNLKISNANAGFRCFICTGYNDTVRLNML